MTTNPETRTCAVIGAGLAGLSAAMRLSAVGARVALYEARPEPGGLLRTSAVNGVRLDTAVQLLSSTYTRLFALARETGASDLLVKSSGRDALWRKGSAHEITYGSISSMATSGALPTLLKLKLATKYVPFLGMNASGLDANDPAGTGGERHDRESIAAWGGRELGSDFVELLTYPLLAAYYGSTPENTSAALYHALARVGMDVQVYAVRGGMSALAQRIADTLKARGVDVRYDTRVTSIAADAGGWRVSTAGTSETFDRIIIATPPDTAAALISTAMHGGQDVHDAQAHDALEALGEWLKKSGTSAAASVSVVVSGAMRAPYFGLSFPRSGAPGDRIVALTLQQNKPASLVPQGMSALTIFPAPSVIDRVAQMDGATALSFLGPSLEKAYPGITSRVAAVEVQADDMRYREMTPGFIHRIQQLRSLRMPEGLAIAGDYTMVPTVEGAVRSGERAAR